jgi:uncharacterized membrane protein
MSHSERHALVLYIFLIVAGAAGIHTLIQMIRAYIRNKKSKQL